MGMEVEVYSWSLKGKRIVCFVVFLYIKYMYKKDDDDDDWLLFLLLLNWDKFFYKLWCSLGEVLKVNKMVKLI